MITLMMLLGRTRETFLPYALQSTAYLVQDAVIVDTRTLLSGDDKLVCRALAEATR